MPRPVDLHALANMPGAGKAEQVLRNSGHWDETKGGVYTFPGMKRWTITLTASISYDAEATVTVDAEDLESATEAAWATVKDCDWNEAGNHDTDPNYGDETVDRVVQVEDVA